VPHFYVYTVHIK